jgi:5-methylcytosine-specific restriction endonuclease McrA
VLLRHSIPNGDPATVIDRALTVLVKQLERTRFANSATPRSAATATPNSRYVPANVKRLVWKRDGGRCAFCGEQGRCTETEFLEFHHIVPYAAGGPTSVDNLALRCRSHNAYESAQRFHR